MKRPLRVIVFFAAALFPVLAVAASSMDTSVIGSGMNGYDFLVGTWTCTNTMAPTKLGALPSTTFTASKLKEGSIFFHTTSPNGDVTGYYAYIPRTGTWYNPFSDSSGYYGYESTRQSGKTIQFTGTFSMANGAPVPIRDTYTMVNARTQYDLSEAKAGGTWKAVAKTTCVKS